MKDAKRKKTSYMRLVCGLAMQVHIYNIKLDCG